MASVHCSDLITRLFYWAPSFPQYKLHSHPQRPLWLTSQSHLPRQCDWATAHLWHTVYVVVQSLLATPLEFTCCGYQCVWTLNVRESWFPPEQRSLLSYSSQFAIRTQICDNWDTCTSLHHMSEGNWNGAVLVVSMLLKVIMCSLCFGSTARLLILSTSSGFANECVIAEQSSERSINHEINTFRASCQKSYHKFD